MILWVILFVTYMIWARFGASGLESAATAGAMVVAGLGVRNFLNTFWRENDRTDEIPQEMRFWTRSSNDKYRRGLFHAQSERLQRGFR